MPNRAREISLTPEAREALDAERERSRRKLLAAEALLLLLLGRTRRAVILSNIRRHPGVVRAQLDYELGRVLYTSKRTTAERSREHLERELGAIGRPTRIPPRIWLPRDSAAAHAAVSGANASWQARVEADIRARAPGGPYRTAPAAPAASRPDVFRPETFRPIYLAEARNTAQLERLAAHQTAEAWNDSRVHYARYLPPGRWVEVWDAALDKRTCDVCLDLDGEETTPGDDFPGGYRPPVHPHCRCLTYFAPARGNHP